MADEHQGEVIIGVDVDAKGFEQGTGEIEKAIKSLETTLTTSVGRMKKAVESTLAKALSKAEAQVDSTAGKAARASGRASAGSDNVSGSDDTTKKYNQLAEFVKDQEKNLALLEELKNKVPTKMQSMIPATNDLRGMKNPIGDPSEYSGLLEQIEHYKAELEQARNSMQRLGESSNTTGTTMQQALSEAAASVSTIDFTRLDISKYGDGAQKYAANVNKANLAYAQQEQKLKTLEAQLSALSNMEQTPEVVKKSAELQGKIEALKAKLQELKLKADEAKQALNDALSGGGVTVPTNNADDKNDDKKSDSFIGRIQKELSLGKYGSKAVGLIASGFGKIGSNISKAASRLNVFNKGQKSAEMLAKRFTRQFTRIFTMLKGRIVRSLVSSLFSGISEGIQALAKSDAEFNRVISQLRSRFSQLKFAVVAAFSPLITYAAPAMQRAMQLVTSLTDKAGQLIAAMTGQKTYKKAAYNYTDYAKSLDKNKKKTDSLTDSTKKLNHQLASFDELNVLNQLEEAAQDEDEESGALTYTELPVSFEISDLSARIKEAFAKGDFRGLGEELGSKLNDEIAKIDSGKVGSLIARIINSAASFAAGFLTTVDWEKLTLKMTDNINALINDVDAGVLGEAFSGLLNTVFTIGFTFGENTDWQQLGQKVGEFVNKVFENTDNFEKAGKTLNKLIIGLLDSILSFFDTIDKDSVNDGLGTFAENIDVSGIALRLGKIFWNILKLSWEVVKAMWRTGGILDFWETQGETWGQKLADKFIIPIRELIRKIKYDFTHENWKELFVDVFAGAFALMINAVIDQLNMLSFDIPEFVPEWGGVHVGFNIPRIELPHLARGTVIPANYGEFAAILGDNKREREFVTPESAMRQVVLEALAAVGFTGQNSSSDDGDFVFQIGSHEIFRVMRKEVQNYKRTHGGKLPW